MLQSAANERPQPNWIRSHLNRFPGDAINHLRIQGNKVETVDVLPLLEAGVNHAGVAVEHFSVEHLLLGRTRPALPEEIVLVFHDTDFF